MNFILIGLCTKGSVRYRMDMQEQLLTPGHVIIASERHIIDQYEASPDLEGMCMMVTVPFYNEIMSNVNELSGGERQKVSIARALAQQTPVLLFDEPTSNLDIKNQIEVLDIMKRIVREKQIIAVVTIHDLNMALRFADKFLVMKDGGIYAFGGREVITEKLIWDVYDVKASLIDYGNHRVLIPD